MQVEEDNILIDVETEFSGLFAQYRKALALLGHLFEPLDTPFTLTKEQEVVFAHCARTLQMFRSIFVLGRFGFGLDCIVLVRVLVELTINAYFIAFEKKRGALHRYIKFGRVEQWEIFRKLLGFEKKWGRTPTVVQQVEPDRIRKMRGLFRRTKKDFQTRNGKLGQKWAKQDLRLRAEFLDQRLKTPGRFEELYVRTYLSMGNPMTHGSALGLSQIPTGERGVRFDASPSGLWVSECFHVCLACIFLIAQLANKVGKMRRQDIVDQINQIGMQDAATISVARPTPRSAH